MTGYRELLTILIEKEYWQKVGLQNNAKYVVKGTGTTSFQLDSSNSLKMSDVLYVPGLKKNLVSTLALEDKGFRVAFIAQESFDLAQDF